MAATANFVHNISERIFGRYYSFRLLFDLSPSLFDLLLPASVGRFRAYKTK